MGWIVIVFDPDAVADYFRVQRGLLLAQQPGRLSLFPASSNECMPDQFRFETPDHRLQTYVGCFRRIARIGKAINLVQQTSDQNLQRIDPIDSPRPFQVGAGIFIVVGNRDDRTGGGRVGASHIPVLLRCRAYLYEVSHKLPLLIGEASKPQPLGPSTTMA